jgi:hypothetical protein
LAQVDSALNTNVVSSVSALVMRWGRASTGRGATFQAIADGLIADEVCTGRGKKKWYAATVRAVVESDNAREIVG